MIEKENEFKFINFILDYNNGIMCIKIPLNKSK